eukprot:Amastigsp_a176233_196.p3 type:complete len:123 gc:universal Amastigsp_a176233_196:150-518(+)
MNGFQTMRYRTASRRFAQNSDCASQGFVKVSRRLTRSAQNGQTSFFPMIVHPRMQNSWYLCLHERVKVRSPASPSSSSSPQIPHVFGLSRRDGSPSSFPVFIPMVAAIRFVHSSAASRESTP